MDEYDVIAQVLLYENWADLESCDHSLDFILAVNWICTMHELEPRLDYDKETGLRNDNEGLLFGKPI